MARGRKPKKYYAWVIAYIIADEVDKVARELGSNPEYKEVEAIIPMVKILKKTLKGKTIFEEVPLLFNYGFFKIPRKYAVHYKFLENMKENISCIYSWVKDPCKKIDPKKPRLDKKGNPKSQVSVATTTAKEVAHLIQMSVDNSIHDSSELSQLVPGQMITLRGYPFEGMQAEFVAIDTKKRKVTVKTQLFDAERELQVEYDNVFFTVYHNKGYDDTVSVVQNFEQFEKFGKIPKK